MSMSSTGRNDNVRHASTDSKSAPPRTVVQMNEMRMFALEVGDENGVKQQVIAFRMNGAWYHDPVGKEWINRLKPITVGGWLATELESRLANASAPVSVPKADVVDVMGGGVKVG
jgi:hypothetical protein